MAQSTMNEKELQNMSRASLLNVISFLGKENKSLLDENAQLKKELEDTHIAICESVSMAEARKKAEGLLDEAQKQAIEIIWQAEVKAERLTSEAQTKIAAFLNC